MSGNEEDRAVPPPSYSEAVSDPRYLASGTMPHPPPPSGPAVPPYSSIPPGQPSPPQAAHTGYQSVPTGYHTPPAPPAGYQALPSGYQVPPTSYQTPPMGYQAPPAVTQATPSSGPYPAQPGYGAGGYPAQTTITYNPYQGNVQCGDLPQGFATTPLAYGNTGQRQDATRFNKICITVICCFVVVSVFIFTMAMALGIH